MSEVIVIDLYSVVPDLAKEGRQLTGTAVPGLIDYVRQELERGSIIYMCAGKACEPFWRQQIENLLERIGIKSVFVTHGVPDGFTLFISRNAFEFNEHFPTMKGAP
jgi:hypothetical protein